MNMVYPQSYIDRAKNSYSLSATEELTLSEILKIKYLKEIIEQNHLSVDDLIFHKKVPELHNTILNITAAERLIFLWNGEISKQKDLKLKQTIQWLKCSTGMYPAILSSELAKLASKDINILHQINTLGVQDPENMKKWDLIRELNYKKIMTKAEGKKAIDLEIDAQFKLLEKFILQNQCIKSEHFVLDRTLQSHFNSNNQKTNQLTVDYFQKIYNANGMQFIKCDFENKSSGSQQGTIAKIQYRKAEHIYNIHFYIKSHQSGSSSSGSSLHPPDPKELLIYKVLEHTGYGPKVHFFYNPLSLGGFFIATQDAGFTKIISKKKKFEPFGLLLKEFDTSLPSTVKIEEHARDITRINMLHRIFVITDLNSDNFGMVTITETEQKSKWKWKIIYFRNSDDNMSYFRPDIYESISEVSMHEYSKFLMHILKNRSRADRLKTEFEIINEFNTGSKRQSGPSSNMPLSQAINTAFIDVFKFINEKGIDFGCNPKDVFGSLCTIPENDMLKTIEGRATKDLTDFCKFVQGIKKNLLQLENDISKAVSYFTSQNTLTSISPPSNPTVDISSTHRSPRK